MMDTLKRYRNWAIGLSAGMALLGLVLILWPETSAITVCWLLTVSGMGATPKEQVQMAVLTTGLAMFFLLPFRELPPVLSLLEL